MRGSRVHVVKNHVHHDRRATASQLNSRYGEQGHSASNNIATDLCERATATQQKIEIVLGPWRKYYNDS